MKNNLRLKRQRNKSKKKKVGLPPGSLIYTGIQKMDHVKITVFIFDETSYEEKVIKPKELEQLQIPIDKLVWVNIDGLHDIPLMEAIANKFNLHALVMEDILNVSQFPKIDAHQKTGILFLSLNEFNMPEQSQVIETDQISIILSKNILLTFQERESEIFNPVIHRLQSGNSRVRKLGTGYLCYALLDTLIDSYGETLEKFDDDFYTLEDDILGKPDENQLHKIHRLNKNMIAIRKATAPVQEIIAGMLKIEDETITEELYVYLRDIQDHIIKVIATIDSDRESLTNMININLSNQSTKMNETVKVLTIISTIFIPLSFIAGIYGMNFKNMPELESQNGYYILLSIMAFIVILQLIYYRYKKWL